MILVINTGLEFITVVRDRGLVYRVDTELKISKSDERNNKIIMLCEDVGFDNILVITDFVEHATC